MPDYIAQAHAAAAASAANAAAAQAAAVQREITAMRAEQRAFQDRLLKEAERERAGADAVHQAWQLRASLAEPGKGAEPWLDAIRARLHHRTLQKIDPVWLRESTAKDRHAQLLRELPAWFQSYPADELDRVSWAVFDAPREVREAEQMAGKLRAFAIHGEERFPAIRGRGRFWRLPLVAVLSYLVANFVALREVPGRTEAELAEVMLRFQAWLVPALLVVLVLTIMRLGGRHRRGPARRQQLADTYRLPARLEHPQMLHGEVAAGLRRNPDPAFHEAEARRIATQANEVLARVTRSLPPITPLAGLPTEPDVRAVRSAASGYATARLARSLSLLAPPAVAAASVMAFQALVVPGLAERFAAAETARAEARQAQAEQAARMNAVQQEVRSRQAAGQQEAAAARVAERETAAATRAAERESAAAERERAALIDRYLAAWVKARFVTTQAHPADGNYTAAWAPFLADLERRALASAVTLRRGQTFEDWALAAADVRQDRYGVVKGNARTLGAFAALEESRDYLALYLARHAGDPSLPAIEATSLADPVSLAARIAPVETAAHAAHAPDGRTALAARLGQEAERFLANLARRNPGATPAERRELLANELARSSTLRRLTAADPAWDHEGFLDAALRAR